MLSDISVIASDTTPQQALLKEKETGQLSFLVALDQRFAFGSGETISGYGGDSHASLAMTG